MSEAMTVELLAEAYWYIQGFWTRVRCPLRTKKGAWSDIDLLAWNNKKKHLVICECKVQQGKNAVYVYSEETEKSYPSFIQKYDRTQEGKPAYLAFIRNLPLIIKDPAVTNEYHAAEKVTVQLVSNYFITSSMKMKVDQEVKSKLKKILGGNVDVRMDSTYELFCRLIEIERKMKQGKRYGHPILDIVREINRFLNPDLNYYGRTKECRQKIEEEIRSIWRKLAST